nr:DNA oxidative demethylase AlkB [Beijerinckia indica]
MLLPFETQRIIEPFADGAVLLRAEVLDKAEGLLEEVRAIAHAAPFRRMVTPGGFTMSVAMTNCGDTGWITDRRGYRYGAIDPESGHQWPAMPALFRAVAVTAAERAGYVGFEPDACLINRYEPGSRMSLHQDKNERDFAQPIVSVSLGLLATFQFGGATRKDPVRKIFLDHADVVVWGGASRLNHHGVLTLKNGWHPSTGRVRYNLTFRKAL